MPKRTDLKTICLIGSGPIVIGQACEFDYAGVQACKALKEEGYRLVLINSNPATIMTDPHLADATYIEPLTPDCIETILRQENVDAILPTMGGQTALNLAVQLANKGVLEELNIELIGADLKAIEKAENRYLFRQSMHHIGIDCLKGQEVGSWQEALRALELIGFPLIIRPSFTLGGIGGGIAHNLEEFEIIVKNGLNLSPIKQVLIEESVIGWKEFELEVMRDYKDQCVIICSIENIEPMGVHTGDSITVAPALTLTDKEYQRMRSVAFSILRKIGIATGGANVQFAIHPKTGRMVVIEMNPRVSRSSALASKATGFPIAKIAAKLAVGYSLDEIPNEITKKTCAAFEPSIDYVVTKIPRFDFEKFEKASPKLSTYMQSVGEVMAIGRTFSESLQKAICSLEEGIDGLLTSKVSYDSIEDLKEKIAVPTPNRLFYIAAGFREGFSEKKIRDLSFWDTWFLNQIDFLVQLEKTIKLGTFFQDSSLFRFFKSLGFSDSILARLTLTTEKEVRDCRYKFSILPSFRRVDTCAAEFSAHTNYMYSTILPFPSSLTLSETSPSEGKKVIVIGSGPNRIGQGIEFDYCCVHAAQALQKMNIETIMINCNPETVSTDHTISDRLYFTPLIVESILDIIFYEKKKGEFLGIFLQFSGQTGLKLSEQLEHENIPFLGLTREAIDNTENRGSFQRLLHSLHLKQPLNRIAEISKEDLLRCIQEIGYPVILRPSYVIGGKGMKILRSSEDLDAYLETVNLKELAPILVEKYLTQGIEIDVDLLFDGTEIWIAGIMQHIEAAGIHSGDSACVFPPYSLSSALLEDIKNQSFLIAKTLKFKGLLNIQFIIQKDKIYVIEVNPRASRTIPFLSKALNIPLVQIAVQLCLGRTLDSFKLPTIPPADFSVKYPIFSFDRFLDVNTRLGPIMKSTGEVMGKSSTPHDALAHAIYSQVYFKSSTRKVALFSDKTLKKPLISNFKQLKNEGIDIYVDVQTAILNPSLNDVCITYNINQLLSIIKNQEIGALFILNEDQTLLEKEFYVAAHEGKVLIYTEETYVLAFVKCFKNLLKQDLFMLKNLQRLL
ncbi:MAG: carbamoyl-phosphate synthase large subunit [Proteobacteria bacterium]|nr:carbamoyl-phosphate synthase large subunit [Pseudomonadota bacterium]